MARQVLPLVGAVAGFAVGGPTGAQIGFALGSLVGNAVDPIEMQGRKLGDSPTQVAAEGGARAIVYGKGCIRATCILERGGRRVIKQRDRSGGKGGGPTTINERALWTFAIGLGEPVAAILRIWEHEKLVYDVTPESTIPEDTAQFAEKFRFYTGAEDQLPDPALEALHGVGNTPYYRGTAYMVFPQYDLTDFGEAVPTYRVEVATESELVVGDVHLGPYVPVALQNEVGPVMWINGDKPLVVTSYSSGSFSDFVDVGQSYRVTEYDLDFAEEGHTDITNTGLPAYPGDERIAVLAINDSGGALCVGGNFPSVARFSNGVYAADLRPTGATDQNWYSGAIEQQMGFDQTGYAWMGDEFIYLGVTRTGVSLPTVHNKIYRWGAAASGIAGASATLEVEPASVATGPVFMMSVSRQGNVHVYRYSTGTITSYDEDFNNPSDLPIPVDVQSWAAGRLRGFGVDELLGIACYVGSVPAGTSQSVVVADLAGGVIDTVALDAVVNESNVCRVVFSNRGAIIQLGQRFYRLEIFADGSQASVKLRTIVAALHDRAGHTSADYDATELTDDVVGVTIEQTVTAAEAINSIIGSHFADPSDYDGQIRYIKRGKPVVLTLTEDDLIDEPDEAQRNNAIEYPKKVHFLGQRADLAYASSKSTSSRYSEDARVVGEITIGSPETYDDPSAPAEVSVKLHKVLWTEAEGEREWLIPDNYLGLVPTDNVGLSYRGELVRCRILNVEDTTGQRKLRMIRDRQSAYTANLTDIPNPPSPTPPQSSVVAPTVMAFIDTSALTDNADTLHYLVALSGANDNWAGAVLQQQLGGSFSSIDSTTLNSIMGVVQNSVSDASPYYTDTTNTVTVRLYTDDELESRSDAEFLSNGGAFFLSWQSSGQTQWEIMQFRDAVQDSNGDWVLSHLMRGRKNTETAEHPPGSMFVWIDPAILREPAQTSWINTVLTHRAVSNGQSPELAAIQNNEYVGNSQREWPVADLLLSRPTADSVLAEAIPRYRFGTSMNPVRSQNMEQFTWVATDGVNTTTVQTPFTTPTYTFDTTGWGSPVTVNVAQWNRLTGDGPTVSEEIV